MQVVGEAEQAGAQLAEQRPALWRAGAKVAVNLSLVVAGVLVAVCLLELLVRQFNPQLLYRYPQGLFVNDADTGYRLAPGFSGRFDAPEFSTSVHINDAGLRDTRPLGRKLPGTRRILVLGDSFTMGHSVEEGENFTHLVEDGLNAAAGGPVFSVLNSGVPGYSTREQLAYLRTRGLALEPDAILLAFFVGNDVADNASRASHMTVVDGYLTSGDTPPGILPFGARSFLSRRSHLYHALYPLQRQLRGMKRDRPEDPLRACGSGDAGLWPPTQELLGELKQIATEHGLPLAMVLIPDMVQVEPELWKRAAQGREGLDPLNPGRHLTAMAEALGVPVLDLLPALTQAAERERLYFLVDHHWTRAGNRVAADAITPFLRDQLVGAQ